MADDNALELIAASDDPLTDTMILRWFQTRSSGFSSGGRKTNRNLPLVLRKKCACRTRPYVAV